MGFVNQIIHDNPNSCFNSISPVREIKKPWGKEIILELNDFYCVKILEISPNKRLSLQYHNEKTESVYVLDGTLRDHETAIFSGDFKTFPKRTVHRFEAGNNPVRLLEISSPHLDDVVRLADDWKRK